MEYRSHSVPTVSDGIGDLHIRLVRRSKLLECSSRDRVVLDWHFNRLAGPIVGDLPSATALNESIVTCNRDNRPKGTYRKTLMCSFCHLLGFDYMLPV